MTAVIGLTVVLSALALYPAVQALAGQNTDLNVGITVTLTAALTLTTAGAGLWGNHHRKRGNDAENRVATLTGRVTVAEEQREALRERMAELKADLDGVRDDLRRLRDPESLG